MSRATPASGSGRLSGRADTRSRIALPECDIDTSIGRATRFPVVDYTYRFFCASGRDNCGAHSMAVYAIH